MRTLLVILTFASCALTSPCVADGANQLNQAPKDKAKNAQAPQPTWDEFAPLYGAEAHTSLVVDFAKKYRLKETKFPPREGIKGDAGIYAPKGQPYWVIYNEGVVDGVFLNFGPWPDVKQYRDNIPYSQTLPCGLLKSDKREDVIRKVGQESSQDLGEKQVITSTSQGLKFIFFFNKAEDVMEGMNIQKIGTQ